MPRCSRALAALAAAFDVAFWWSIAFTAVAHGR